MGLQKVLAVLLLTGCLGDCPSCQNLSTCYVRPAGRRVLTVLGSADSSNSAQYLIVTTAFFEQLRSTSTLSLLAGGCSGLMGAGSVFCAKGPLGETCNAYNGFGPWCDPSCETKHFMKMHLVGSKANEEEIISGGSSFGRGDAFLLLPGGIGTTREAYDILQANFEYGGVNKPIFCLNVAVGRGGFYDGLVAWIQTLYARKLARAYSGSNGSSMFVSNDASELAIAIDNWVSDGRLPEKLRLENLNIAMPGLSHTITV